METIKDFKPILEERIKSAEQVFLSPHLNADFDTIASCIGMALIVKKLGKQPYIIMDEDPILMEPGVKIIVDEVRKLIINKDGETIPIITTGGYKKLQGDNDLLITLDLNKKYLTGCKDYLDSFKDIVVIDHHQGDQSTIDTPYTYINPDVSSVSELMVELLCAYSIKFDKRIADYLLAGIYLDTDKFKRNTKAVTMALVTKLMEKGADLERVNELFAEDFYSDRKVQDLVSQATFFTYNVATVVASPIERFNREQLAKVADYLLRFRADASFAVGHINDDTISISARSKGAINVGAIMSDFGGGGSNHSAAGKIVGEDIAEVGLRLNRALKPSFYVDKDKKDEKTINS